mgnify:CR=1 FL=1
MLFRAPFLVWYLPKVYVSFPRVYDVMMKRLNRAAELGVRLFFLVAGLGLLCPTLYAAEGNELIGIGAVQIGTGGAGIAAPKDATWSFLNPASMVDLERRIDIGVEALFLKRKAEPRGPLVVLNYQSSQEDLFLSLANNDAGTMSDSSPMFSPILGVIWPFEDFTLGVGVFGVQGNAVDYPRSRSVPGRRRNHRDRRADLQVLKMPIAIAHRFPNDWAVGAALVGVYSRLRTDSLTLEITPTRGDFDWDDSYGLGFKFSLYKRWDRWSFGATYTTRQWTTEFSKYRDLVTKHLDFPQQFQVGVAYRPSRWWELVADYKFIDWSGISQIGREAVHGGLNWDDQHIVKVGATYRASRLWTFRLGFSYGESPVPRNAVFTNVLFPAISEKHLTAGFTYRLTPQADLHFAYLHAFENTMRENGKGDIFSIGGRGTKFSLEQDSVAVEFSYKFKAKH